MRRLTIYLIALSLVVATGAFVYVNRAAPPPPGPPGRRPLTAFEERALPVELQPLLALHQPLAAPESNDWLASHDERGETYREYLAAQPTRATAERRTICVQPLGDFTPEERAIVDLAAEFLGLFYQLPVRVSDDLPSSIVPAEARRDHPQWGEPQVLTSYVSNHVLKPRVPDDAAAYIALTAEDLWPGHDWNFVFGEASLRDRVGVWSIHRLGNTGGNAGERLATLRRTLKLAAHETGHMFSLPHCVHFECVMNGTNHRDETDRHPLWACPQCLAKLIHATGADPQVRFEKLAKFADENGLAEEKTFWEKSLSALRAK